MGCIEVEPSYTHTRMWGETCAHLSRPPAFRSARRLPARVSSKKSIFLSWAAAAFSSDAALANSNTADMKGTSDRCYVCSTLKTTCTLPSDCNVFFLCDEYLHLATRRWKVTA